MAPARCAGAGGAFSSRPRRPARRPPDPAGLPGRCLYTPGTQRSAGTLERTGDVAAGAGATAFDRRAVPAAAAGGARRPGSPVGIAQLKTRKPMSVQVEEARVTGWIRDLYQISQGTALHGQWEVSRRLLNYIAIEFNAPD